MTDIATYDKDVLQAIREEIEDVTAAPVEDAVEEVQIMSGGPGLRPETIDSYDLDLSLLLDFAVDTGAGERSLLDASRRWLTGDGTDHLQEGGDLDYHARLPVHVDLPGRDELAEMDAERIAVRFGTERYDSLTRTVEGLDGALMLDVTPRIPDADGGVSVRMRYDDGWTVAAYHDRTGADAEARYRNLGRAEEMVLDADLDIELPDDGELGRYRSDA